MNLGDYTEDYAALNFKFHTLNVSEVPTTLSGTPAISVYKANGTTQTTAGITLTADFDAVTGLNNVLIDLSADAFYVTGQDYHVVVTTGTVNSVSWVGRTVATFSIQNRYHQETAVGSAAISTVAESYTLTTGAQSSGAYTDTETQNAVYHEHTDTAGTLELYYQFDVTGAGVATEVEVIGRINGSNDSLDGIYAYDWSGAGWDRLGDYDGKNPSPDDVRVYSLLTRHTGSGANIGKVRIRFYAASGLTSATLHVDQIFTSYAVVSQTVGYDGGKVWIDTTDGIAGTEPYVNGVADKQVLTFADALIIGSDLKLHQYNISPDSTLAPTADLNNVIIFGIGYTLNLGGYDYAGTHIHHASPVNGIATSANNSDHFDILDSIIVDVTVDDSHFTNCSFKGTVTFGSVASSIRVINCRSIIAGATTPIFDFGTAAGINHNLTIADWQNGIEIRNFNNSGTDLMSLSGAGQLVIAATCSGTINLRGQWNITDNSGGAVTITRDDVAEVINNLPGSLLTTQLTESYAADNVAPTLAQAIMLIQQALTEFQISGSIKTVKKLDGTTTAAEMTFDSAITPTSTTRTS